MSSMWPSDASSHLPPIRFWKVALSSTASRATLAFIAVPLLFKWQEREFDSPVRRAPRLVCVARYRMVFARTYADGAFCLDSFCDQVVRYRVSTPLGECLVIFRLADIVRMASNFNDSLFIFLENHDDAVQHFWKRRAQFGATGLERNVARHIQRDVIALACHRNAGTFHLLA